jgi:hypothetical protein
MKWALYYYRGMTIEIQNAWSALHVKDSAGKIVIRGPDDRLAINPAIPAAFARNLDAVIPTWNDLVTGQTDLHSVITDDVVTVNLPAFFNSPPSDLKKLLPDGFNKEGPYKTHDGITYRNYLFESPTSWKKEAYNTLFPTLKKGAQVAEFQRTLLESRGGGLVGWPLSIFVK